MSETENYTEQIKTLNRSIGQLKRHNTIWAGWPNDKKISAAKRERNQAQYRLKIARENVEAAASFEWLGF